MKIKDKRKIVEKKVFITSDTHYGHEAMIKYRWRNFKNINDMNLILETKFNNIVGKKDDVFHLGDVAMGDKHNYKINIEPRLNGNITYIKGNHDSNSTSMIKSAIITWKGQDIELVHNPNNASGNTPVILHGHIHKSGYREFEIHVNATERVYIVYDDNGVFYYNVNVEFHKYRPKYIAEILGEIKLLRMKLKKGL